MIRYALSCRSGHSFESWFPSSADYDDQRARGFVSCPTCGSGEVDKQIMAPAVARADRDLGLPAPAPSSAPAVPASAPAAAAAPVALVSEGERRLRAALRQIREHVRANAEDVGRSFPEEARRIHAGEAPERLIVGEASGPEVAELLEEGVPVHPLPILPDDRN